MSLDLLKRVFSGEPTEFSGRRLIPFNYYPEHPLRRLFDSWLLGLTPDTMPKYWIDRHIRGKGSAPRTLPSPAVLKVVVARIAGAIGYLPAAAIDDSVRTLTVNWKDVRDPDYPLTTR